jgi:hypothetical protein
MRDLAWSVLHESFEDGLWTALPLGAGQFKVAKTTLSPAQYGAASTRLSELDEFGFTPAERRDFEQAPPLTGVRRER